MECWFYWSTPRNNIYSTGELSRILKKFLIALTEIQKLIEYSLHQEIKHFCLIFEIPIIIILIVIIQKNHTLVALVKIKQKRINFPYELRHDLRIRKLH